MLQSGFQSVLKTVTIEYSNIWLTGLIITAGAASQTVALYDGQDADSGRKLHTFKPPNGETKVYTFDNPIIIERGLHVVLSADITEVTVLYVPYDNPEYKSRYAIVS